MILGRDNNEEITLPAIAVSTTLGMPVASAACGTVSVAEMNWASAQLMAIVDKIILESDMVVTWKLFPATRCQHLRL